MDCRNDVCKAFSIESDTEFQGPIKTSCYYHHDLPISFIHSTNVY